MFGNYQDLDFDSPSVYAVKRLNAYRQLILNTAFPTMDMCEAFQSYCEQVNAISENNATLVTEQRKLVNDYLQLIEQTYFQQYPPTQ